ncbi:MAG: GNAT family N-acetyltransferase [Gemmatimonadaceae bacterium]
MHHSSAEPSSDWDDAVALTFPRLGPRPVAPLSDGEVLLRPHELRDVDAVYEAAKESVGAIYPWMEWCHPGYARDESAVWVVHAIEAFAAAREFNFAVWDAAGTRLLGGCGLNQFNLVQRFANLGYWVRASATGRGVATRATRLLARFAFERLSLNRVEIVVAVGNEASVRVAEKAGAVREGILRNRLTAHGVRDAVMHSLVPADFGL